MLTRVNGHCFTLLRGRLVQTACPGGTSAWVYIAIGAAVIVLLALIVVLWRRRPPCPHCGRRSPRRYTVCRGCGREKIAGAGLEPTTPGA